MQRPRESLSTCRRLKIPFHYTLLKVRQTSWAARGWCWLYCCKGPSSFEDPDIPALLVMAELLDTMEGIFWKFIRGQGLAYSCFLSTDVEAGLISFTIYQSPDTFKAFAQAKSVTDQLVNKQVSWLSLVVQIMTEKDWQFCVHRWKSSHRQLMELRALLYTVSSLGKIQWSVQHCSRLWTRYSSKFLLRTTEPCCLLYR